MDGDSLTKELSYTFAKLDGLLQLHNEALAYDQAHERTLYLHEHLVKLEEELVALRTISVLLSDALDDASWEETWRGTCRELKRRQPSSFDKLAHALTTESLELLQWVAYVASATDLVREQHTQLKRYLLQILQPTRLKDPRVIASPDPLLLSTLTQLADLPLGEDAAELHSRIKELATRARGDSNYGSP